MFVRKLDMKLSNNQIVRYFNICRPNNKQYLGRSSVNKDEQRVFICTSKLK